jgi:type II secretory pathway component GspD/PulD (secretin)
VPPLPPLPASAPLSIPALKPLPRARGSSFDLRFVPVAQVIDLLYDQAVGAPHVLSPDVLADQRTVSFKYDALRDGDVRRFVVNFLESLGYVVRTKDGVDFVEKQVDAGKAATDSQVFVYVPRYRHADYLARLVQPIFAGRVTANRTVTAPEGAKVASDVPATSAAAQIDQSVDQLVFVGTADEVARLRKVLPELDTAPGEVVVRGWIYEVDDTDSNNSAFSLAVKIFGGELSISNGSIDTRAVTFKGPALSAAISALNADTRFHEVSAPHVRVLSGQHVRLNVGEQVPTEGSVSYQGVAGTPVQSITYQDAGLIFDVQPTVMAGSIELSIDEELSDFVATTTGVDSSPTKQTRSLRTTTRLADGEVIVLGGLVQDQGTTARSHIAWLPRILDGRTGSKARSEVLLVLQVQRL